MMTRAFLLILSAGTIWAQMPALSCDGLQGHGRACRVVEMPVSFAGSFTADTGGNGSITVGGWDNNYVLVQARIETSAPSNGEAQALLQQVNVDIGDGAVTASGPYRLEHESWSVSYAISIPHGADMTLTTANGAITLADVAGTIRFSTANGAISLARLGGDVQGHTVNGAIDIVLGGSAWDGKQLDAATMNGALRVVVPAAYSAHFELSNKLGTIKTNLPVTVARSGLGLGGAITFDDGAGGALIRATTINGAITLTAVGQ